jgi:hypothetical protein
MICISHVEPDERFTLEKRRLPGGLNVFLLIRAGSVPPPSCDTLAPAECHRHHRPFAISDSLWCELDVGRLVVGMDMARFLLRGAGRGFESSSGGGVRDRSFLVR